MKDQIKNGVLIIDLEGNMIGTYASGPLIDLITKNIESGNKKVLFNLSEMKFIDSTGLGYAAHHTFQNPQGRRRNGPVQLPEQMHGTVADYPIGQYLHPTSRRGNGTRFFDGLTLKQ